jgi:hypothetical protein
MAAAQPTECDVKPPLPVAEYEHTVKSVNMGYEFILTLTYAFLRALRKPDLDLLVVGAGGGAEIERFLPDNPGWRVCGVDPSQEMLDLAAVKAERLGCVGGSRPSVERWMRPLAITAAMRQPVCSSSTSFPMTPSWRSCAA